MNHRSPETCTQKHIYVTACLYHRHTAEPLSKAHAHERCIAGAINRLWLSLFDLGGLFHNKQSVCVCVCAHAGVRLLIICCQRSRLYVPPIKCFGHCSAHCISHHPQCAPTSFSQGMFPLSGKPKASGLSNTVPSQTRLSALQSDKILQHHLSAGPWHKLEENICKGTQTNCEAEAKSLRPAFLLVLLFLGSEIRHAVSKATTFDHLGRGEGVGWLMKCS